MLKLYRLAENHDFYFIAETKCNQVFVSGKLETVRDAMIGFFVKPNFWFPETIEGETYLKWLKATLF